MDTTDRARGEGDHGRPSGRVMLIDDDLEILELLAEWLEGRGHEVQTIADGSKALEAAKAFRPQVVVLDGVLRGTTGAMVADQLREENLGCRIIFLSGLSRSEFPAEEEVLEKPIDLLALEETILKQKPRDSEGSVKTTPPNPPPL